VLTDITGYTFTSGTPTSNFTLQTNCQVNYTDSGSNGAFPTIVVVSTGCT